ncbi:MAG: hypothetical protein ACR2PF_09320 [Rhizobiaceae bacterium]
MSLSFLVAIVVAGLTAVISAVHFSGGMRAGKLDEDSVREIWKLEFVDDAVTTIIVSDDRKAAVVALNDWLTLGLVRQMGAHHIVRRLERGSVRQVTNWKNRLNLRLNDTTLPFFAIFLADDGRRSGLARQLEAFVEPQGGSNA